MDNKLVQRWDHYHYEWFIGRAFEGKGGTRVITGIETETGFSSPDIYWKRPGGKERKQPIWGPYFRGWLKTAKEVSP